jgi:hypothetical protein
MESASVTITDNSGGNPGTTQTITLSGTGVAPPVAATPQFSVAGGSYNSVQSVSIADATPGATIYYTTNNTTPTASSTKYTGTAIVVGASETLQAIAILTGYQNSAVALASYTITLTTVAMPTFTPGTSTVATGSTVTIADATAGATIYYTTNNSLPTTSSTSCASPCVVTLNGASGTVETIEAFAALSGYNNSTVVTAAYTITLPQAPTPYYNPAGGNASLGQPVTIFDNAQGGTIYYTTNGTTPTTSSASCSVVCSITLSTLVGTETIEAIATGPGYSTSAVGSATFTILPTAPAPTFSPAGGTVPPGSTVTISDTVAGATITYLIIGGGIINCVAPCSVTLSSTIGAAQDFQASALATGYSPSATTAANYTIAAPSFTFTATAANPAPTGSVTGTQANPAATDVTFTLALVAQSGYNTPVNISIAVGQGASADDDVPTVSCVDAGGVTFNSTKLSDGTINCTGSFTPTAGDGKGGGGTPVWVTFSADGNIPNPTPNPAISRPRGKSISRAASGGLGISLAGLVLGTFARRRRLVGNAVKLLALACMVASLGVLVGGCELIASVDRSKIPSSTDIVSSTITATPVGGGTPQSVTVWVTYNVNN